MLKRSSHISNSSVHHISYKALLRYLTSLTQCGYKTEFAFDHLPDVYNSDFGRCAAQSHTSWAQVPVKPGSIFQLGFFAYLQKLLISMQWSP